MLARALYRHRAPDRRPCETCPERDLPVCRGFKEVVRREKAFSVLSRRLLERAGV
ncbi:hypothetical protein HY251_03485 [bacterium]|nr:hypothetical protein [bacterium]